MKLFSHVLTLLWSSTSAPRTVQPLQLAFSAA